MRSRSAMQPLDLVCEFGRDVVYQCTNPWRVRFYDRYTEQFYAGSGDSVWEALAWALVEREQRIAHSNMPLATRCATPAQAMAALAVA
jgi:hypothetical protein